ncbi:hypothetical protein QR685DRAFT_606258 [Neurospora intermedia]|uniref:Uncharacterized protein n=1 Tax=Neurospora intermedia TaxID=5142 RepID=A0ABR3DEE4_NEUIN
MREYGKSHLAPAKDRAARGLDHSKPPFLRISLSFTLSIDNDAYFHDHGAQAVIGDFITMGQRDRERLARTNLCKERSQDPAHGRQARTPQPMSHYISAAGLRSSNSGCVASCPPRRFQALCLSARFERGGVQGQTSPAPLHRGRPPSNCSAIMAPNSTRARWRGGRRSPPLLSSAASSKATPKKPRRAPTRVVQSRLAAAGESSSKGKAYPTLDSAINQCDKDCNDFSVEIDQRLRVEIEQVAPAKLAMEELPVIEKVIDRPITMIREPAIIDNVIPREEIESKAALDHQSSVLKASNEHWGKIVHQLQSDLIAEKIADPHTVCHIFCRAFFVPLNALHHFHPFSSLTKSTLMQPQPIFNLPIQAHSTPDPTPVPQSVILQIPIIPIIQFSNPTKSDAVLSTLYRGGFALHVLFLNHGNPLLFFILVVVDVVPGEVVPGDVAPGDDGEVADGE